MADEREVTIRLKVLVDQAGKAALGELERETRKVTAATKDQAATVEKATREHAAANRAMLGSMGQLREGSMLALGGVTQLGRGLAILGVSGEKDLQKVLAGLMKIQAAFDVLRGGASVVFGIAKAWDAYKVSVTAAAAAQASQAALGAGGAAAGAAGGAVGAAGGAGVVAAADRRGRLRRRPAGRVSLKPFGAILGHFWPFCTRGPTARKPLFLRGFLHFLGCGPRPGTTRRTGRARTRTR